MKTAIKFINKTNEDFTHNYDGETYTFKSGESKLMQKPMAEFFAYKLAMKQIIQKDTIIVEEDVKNLALEYIVKGEVIVADSENKLEMAILNESNNQTDEISILQEVCELQGIKFDKRWGIKKLKEAIAERQTKEIKTEEEDKEDEFEGLKQ
jgi:hypothetical protein